MRLILDHWEGAHPPRSAPSKSGKASTREQRFTVASTQILIIFILAVIINLCELIVIIPETTFLPYRYQMYK